MTNAAAELEGEFSRVDYDDFGVLGAKNALRNLDASLPLKSWNLQVWDKLGNITTTQGYRHFNETELNIQPRFPLMGGWRNEFYVKYNLPTKFRVLELNGVFETEVEFGSFFDGIVSEQFELELVLPVGARDVSWECSSEIKVSEGEFTGMLDFFPRKTVWFSKKFSFYEKRKVKVVL